MFAYEWYIRHGIKPIDSGEEVKNKWSGELSGIRNRAKLIQLCKELEYKQYKKTNICLKLYYLIKIKLKYLYLTTFEDYIIMKAIRQGCKTYRNRRDVEIYCKNCKKIYR
jgi:hypothetical protein